MGRFLQSKPRNKRFLSYDVYGFYDEKMFNEQTVKKEFEELMKEEEDSEKVDEDGIELNNERGTQYFTIRSDMGREYIVLETESDAEDLAKERVKEDLEKCAKSAQKESILIKEKEKPLFAYLFLGKQTVVLYTGALK